MRFFVVGRCLVNWRTMKCAAVLLAALLLLCLGIRPVQAGGGPENLFLVVNSRSYASVTVANYYIHLRKIPPINVYYLDWEGGLEFTDVDTFRNKILGPVFSAMENRGLSDQIDYIIYSADVPYRIDFVNDIPPDRRDKKDPLIGNPAGSITGLTYLSEYVFAKNPQYAGFLSNFYVRGPSLGFRGWYGFGLQSKSIANGELELPKAYMQESGGARYHLSMMLGVTYGRGNTLPEVIDCLRRSARADGTHPQGTVYFMKNSDVRSTTREKQFEPGVKNLKSAGSHGEIVAGTLPEKKSDVIGLMAGSAKLDWGRSGSKLLPGAICEHLTSFGGVFAKNVDQTPLSEFIRYGAAGASGTVTEPFAIFNKFPMYNMHVHYARGCSLAESFYQGVLSPYQLLIVGDPLCAPYATPPVVDAVDIKAGEVIKGKRTIKPVAEAKSDAAVRHFELFVNGVRHSACHDGESLTFDSTAYPDGYAELRIVGLEESLIETQGRAIIPVMVNNRERKIEFIAKLPEEVKPDKKIKLAAKAPGSIGVAFYHNGQLLDKFSGESGEVEIDTNRLGYGPVTLSAIGWGRGGVENNVVATPVSFGIVP